MNVTARSKIQTGLPMMLLLMFGTNLMAAPMTIPEAEAAIPARAAETTGLEAYCS